MKQILVIGNGVVGNANVKLFKDSGRDYEVDVYDKEKSKSEINLKFVFDSQGKVYNMIILALPTVAFLLHNLIHCVVPQKL